MPSVIDFIQEDDKENIIQNKNQQPSLCYLECENQRICQDGEFKFERNDYFNSLDSILIADELVYEELKGFNFIQKINEIYNKMKICPKYLDLNIDIKFSQTHTLISFASQINKIAKYTKNLKWNINSLIQLGKYVYIIADILGLFRNTKKLELIFNSINSFSKQGVILLFEQLKNLDKLKHLKLNVKRQQIKSVNSLIALTISKDFEEQLISKSIEYIQSNIFEFYSLINFPNLSIYYCQNNNSEQINYEQLTKHIIDIQAKLVEIVLTQQIIESINSSKQPNQIKYVVDFTKLLVKLPYLTKINLKDFFISNQKLKSLFNLINQYINYRRSKVQQLIVYNLQIAQLMQLNPRNITLDLWYN
ncbi:hypothetical protein ABPG74_004092 [Tetrahymena malaccensis]